MRTIQLAGITIYKFTWDIVDSNSYVICENHDCLIVDPIDSNEMFIFLRNQNIAGCTAILTHAHFDHICGLNKLRCTFDKTNVICSKQCSANIQNPRTNLSNMANAYIAFQNKTDCVESIIEPFFCDEADVVFEENYTYKWKEHTVQAQEMKGHSPDGLCCLLDGKYLFTGDTLLATPTVTRFPGGSTRQYKDHDIPLLQKLLIMTEVVFPGHGDTIENSEQLLI